MIPYSEVTSFLQRYSNQNSLRAYRTVLLNFQMHHSQLSAERMFEEHLLNKAINNFLKELHSTKKAKSTISRTIYILNCFFKYCIDEGYLTKNPMTKYERVRLTYADFKAATLPEGFNFEVFLNTPDQYSFKGNNERLVLFLITAFGLKRSEILKLKMGDLILDEEDKKLIIPSSKKFRTRVYSLSEDSLKEFEGFLARREQYSKYSLDVNDYILQSSSSDISEKPIDGSTIYRIIERNLPKQADPDLKINPSSFRLHKALTDIHTRRYYELQKMFGISHKEITKYKVLEAKERFLKESKELIDMLVKQKVEAELDRLSKHG